MDLGFLAARTEFCVALDVDAFPIRGEWIETIRAEPEQGAAVIGATFPVVSGLRHTVGTTFGDFACHDGSTTRAADPEGRVEVDGIEDPSRCGEEPSRHTSTSVELRYAACP